MKNIIAKITSLILVSVVVFSGCTSQKSNKASSDAGDKNKELTVAASFYPMYIFSLNVAKDVPNVKVIDMTKPMTGCLHDYSITTDDMKTLDAAQVFVTNGAGMESFMDKVTKQMPNLKVIDSSTGIQLIKGEGDEGDNPHLWVSISNAITQVKNIGEQLAIADPKNSQKYKSNTAEYVVKLEAQRDKMHKVLDTMPNRDIVTFHEAFPYFAKEFNLNIVGVIEREPGSAPSAKELQESVEQVKKLKVKALFAEPQYPAKSAETIAKETGSKVYTLDPVVTGPMEADAYINIMDSNLKVLQEALK
ncbi:metal ABC transporter substrate-binding protein [Clostridium bowmanii]|uniref:metal ABC transporter substrate-binding protein n=1 Tax=Clostridium bowmanii TaxID=132925 RepID=UPI001C0E0554|nr:metal ABC transporter substrate-binding protein [Clostridium bowmanii]MBU3190857.1 metal ABC transporter substrate-binding protein [Clostridium bowmanii]MCA1075239.1 metal ABC transporter substrate-binding protein [Clostridium bowmanii]